jgi:hypothetical protein
VPLCAARAPLRWGCRRVWDPLAVKGYDTSATKLACYSEAGFDVGLHDAAHADSRMQLFGLDVLYSCGRRSGRGRRLYS